MAFRERIMTGLSVVAISMAMTAVPLVSGGCGSSFDGRVYHGDGFTFRVPPKPPTWSQLDVNYAALAYEDSASGGTIGINARCDRDGEDVPLNALTQHLFIQFTERDTHSQETLPFDGREAMRSDITAKLDGVPRRLVIWVMKKDKCVFDLMFLAPPEGFARGVETFDAFAKGFSASRQGDQ